MRRRVDGQKEMTHVLYSVYLLYFTRTKVQILIPEVKKAAGTKEYRALVTSAEYDLMQV